MHWADIVSNDACKAWCSTSLTNSFAGYADRKGKHCLQSTFH